MENTKEIVGITFENGKFTPNELSAYKHICNVRNITDRCMDEWMVRADNTLYLRNVSLNQIC